MGNIRLVLIEPNEILHQASEPVTEEELKTMSFGEGLIADLIATMIHHKAAGIAAPQIGVLKRVIVAMEPNDNGLVVLINPVVLKTSKKIKTAEEGCLSCPAAGIIMVIRYDEIKIRSITLDGTTETLKYRGTMARELQHEIDHLDGKLITDA